jgi:hypothetical protein
MMERKQMLESSRLGRKPNSVRVTRPLESLPYFLVAGPLFVFTDPSVVLARWLLYGFVVFRPTHFAAYFTAQTHDMRATL